ncbi:Transcriptional repressor ILP1 [Sesamum alatum]|uniref:Transcriptional repressor ILP1 n=1 Tax=Sesamum alatum TaxID=300844 RepID=A0AAE2CIP5_9LAMI|nr:Transcriptional repressor ILP1 [Sesamum alatum]
MSAKSRNFRRRAGDDEDEDDNSSAAPSTAKSNGAPSTTNRPSATSKPKKTSSQPPSKSLLSFADDDDESPFSRPAPKPSSSSSSRLSKSSAHKLTSSKDRLAPHPPSSSLPSNVQPQAGVYTKEALLELQKNTKTLAAPARNKPKPEPEPVVVLKGLIKPVIANDLDSGTTGKSQDFEDDDLGFDRKRKDLSIERNDALSRLKDIGLGTGLREDEEVIPDKATIEAIRAKRERLRQAKAAAPDYIALDGGSNHGEAEGLSDEEPEFQGRIGFFGEKIGGVDKKGVFEDFEEKAMAKERGTEMVSEDEDEDEEDKMWEEEQVRKGLGKRLDDGVGTQGVGGSVTGVSSIRQSGSLQPSFGYLGSGTSGMHPPVQNVDATGSYSSIGGAGGELYGSNVMSISQQAEVAKKALNENLRRVKESHGRTMVSLAKTEENLSSSLLNITSLENSLAAAGEKFLFMQKLREFVSVICEFLQHKAPFIEELEEQMQKLHEERARAITERRTADNDDEISEIEQAIIAARAEFRKGVSNPEKVAAAIAASQIASANARALKSAPVELDEFGRDVNLQKRMDITRRAEARQRRRAKADSKRKLALENDNANQQIEGELSTDESDSESTAYESTHNQLLEVADKIFSDAAEDFSQFSIVVEKFERWKKDYASSYRDAYMSLSIPAIFSPYVRLELLKWDPLHEDADFIDMKWHSLLFNYGLPEDGNEISGEDTEADADANLIPELVEKLAIPILHHQLAHCWDMFSTRETKYAVSAMNLIIRYVNLSSSALAELVTVLRDRLTKAVADLMVPTWSPLEMKAVPNAARVAAYRFGTCVRLMRNICLWDKILAMPILEKIALDELLCGKVLPHLHSIQSNVHDAIVRTERIIASLYGVWTGPSVTGDRSQKLQPLVDYLLLIGKTLEKKYAMETESGKLVRRLKKMLVELNEYDHARALSRTFNLKEAL